MAAPTAPQLSSSNRAAHPFRAASGRKQQQHMRCLQPPAAVQHTAPLGHGSSRQAHLGLQQHQQQQQKQQQQLLLQRQRQHCPHPGLLPSIQRHNSSQIHCSSRCVVAAASSSSCSSSGIVAPLPRTAAVNLRHLRSGSSSSSRRQQPVCRARGGQQPPPDPWQQSPQGRGTSPGFGPAAATSSAGTSSSTAGPGPLDSFDPWDAAAPASGPVGGVPQYERTDWGWDAANEDWDPAEGLGPQQLEDLERDYLDGMQRRRAAEDPPRDKWITPLLDWQSISGAFDPDQSRTEDAMADEALTNKEESREALAFTGRLVAIPLVTGALISRAITDPVLSFSLQNNPNAFAMSEHQKIEGAMAVHLEEARVRMMMAIGQAPPLNDKQMLDHLREYAHEVQEEERHKNEASLMTLVSDSISAGVFFAMFLRDNAGRAALFNTIGRLFEGLSDIAKAVMIILVADTLLGYHSEEGWTGFLDLFLGHYGIEVEEENIVLFVGIIPIAIDVFFKYWIFIGLNKISPGAVVTIKQLDRH